MTSTLDPQTTAEVTPQQRIDAWLADFETALAVRDIERVTGMFAVDSFWRDLVSFTWNLKTLEGRDQIADMLGARLIETDPSGFRTREAPTQDGTGEDAVTSAFIEFETGAGRGIGHLRLKGGSGVDAADRAAGAEGARGAQGRGPAEGRRARRRSGSPVVGREEAPPRTPSWDGPRSRTRW